MALQKVELHTLQINPFEMIGKQWMLISAGNEQKFNTMTASWGGIGVMWGVPSTMIFIRQTRYTKEFVDAGEYYTLTFLKEGHREALNRLGKQSGREIDKMTDSGLTPLFLEGQPTFAEAQTVLICKKRYAGPVSPEDFIDPTIATKWYGDKNYHTMYIGEIVACYCDQ